MLTSDPTKASGAVRPPKQATKVRHSITLSSVSKALADVMNKDSGKSVGSEKPVRKSKDVSARRSAVGSVTRASMDVQSIRRSSPETNVTVRHTRGSSRAGGTTSSEEGSAKLADISEDVSVGRNSTLKPKSNNSALPKYRPRSVEPSGRGPPTPPLVSARRMLTSSPEDKAKERRPSSSSGTPLGPVSSPVKRTVKQHTRAASDTPTLTSKKENGAPRSSRSKLSLAKPTRIAATVSAGPVMPGSPSSTSNSPSSQSPSTPTRKRVLAGVSGGPFHNLPPSPLRSSQGSHAGNLVHMGESSTTTSSDSPSAPNTPSQTEGDSYDSFDVELMLGHMISPTAPTPALPRVKASRTNHHVEPTTPTRLNNFLPSRSNLSYLSPLPPSDDSPPSLRPKPKNPSNDRGSLLSWEQLAAHTSINEDVDVDHMLSEIPAPFRSGAVSPAPSAVFDLPDSPSLNTSMLSSPEGYQSISRVLLPEVTPSPAAHRSVPFEKSPQADDNSAIATLLRLQLASAENLAKERLEQMKSLENQLHAAKQARIAEVEELSKQVFDMESQLRCSLEARERTDDERAAYTASLEHQLRQLAASRKHDLEIATAQAKAHSVKLHDTTFAAAQRRWDVASCAQQTANSWSTVRSLTEGQLELVRSNRECLSILLSGLDNIMQGLRSQRTN